MVRDKFNGSIVALSGRQQQGMAAWLPAQFQT
jgi:hypothetical protein